MELQSQPQLEKLQTPPNETRAEQLLALRAPLVERDRRVADLEFSISAHDVEAKALYALWRSAIITEKVLVQDRDEARREIEIAKLESNIIRERLRIADNQLAEITDLAHVKERAHLEELNTLRKRCSAMKRKIDFLTTGQKREQENRIRDLKDTTEDLRKEILEITSMRDEWRETAVSTEQELEELKAKHAKLQTVSALLETERTLSASLRIYLKDAREAATTAERENAKLAARASGKEKTDKALHAEKEKNSQLRQKVKDADASSKKMKREEAKLRQKCENLEKRLEKALARAVKAEEQAAELNHRPTTRSQGLATPRQDALISPAPLTFGRRPAEDMASESRSRFTTTLPQGIQDEGSTDDEESEELSPRETFEDPSPRVRGRNPKSRKTPPPRKTIAKRAPRRAKTDSELLKTPETKKQRQPTSFKKSSSPITRGESATTSPPRRSAASPRTATPRRKHGKATRKTTASSRAKRQKEASREESGSSDFLRRTLRVRRPVSYNYDEEESDFEEESDVEKGQRHVDEDYKPLQPVRVTRSAKKREPDSDSLSESSEEYPSNRVTSRSTRKRPRRMETVRKQVPTTRSGVK